MTPRSSLANCSVVIGCVVIALGLAGCSARNGTDSGSGSTVQERQESGATVYYQEETSPVSADDMTAAEYSSEDAAMPGAMEESSASAMSDGGVVTAGGVTVTEEPDRTEAQAGERLWFTVTISNKTNAAMRGIQVENAFPVGKLIIIDPAGGSVSGDQIQWTIDTLEAGQTRALRFQGQLAGGLKQGDSILNIVTVLGTNLSARIMGTSNVQVLSKLPKTGEDVRFLSAPEDTSKYVRKL